VGKKRGLEHEIYKQNDSVYFGGGVVFGGHMTYYCSKCKKKHRESSKIGKEHIMFKEKPIIVECDNCGVKIPRWLAGCWYCGEFRDARIQELADNMDESMVELTDLQESILKQLKKSRNIGIDKLSERLKRDKRGLLMSLRALERKNLVKSRDGKSGMIWSTK